MKELLSGLVGYASENPPGREAEVALYLTAILKELGFDVYSPELSPGRCNVVARLDNGDGPTLGFNSHLDVAPAGQGWTGDPFRLIERNGRLYGRGACDAKGSIVAMVEVMRLLKLARREWQGRVIGVDRFFSLLSGRKFLAFRLFGMEKIRVFVERDSERLVRFCQKLIFKMVH